MTWFDKERFIEKSDNMTSKIPLLLQILGYEFDFVSTTKDFVFNVAQ